MCRNQGMRVTGFLVSLQLHTCTHIVMQRRIGIPEDDSDSSGGEREEMELSDSESDEEGGRSRRLRSGYVCCYGHGNSFTYMCMSIISYYCRCTQRV